jgi:hypothetical protein
MSLFSPCLVLFDYEPKAETKNLAAVNADDMGTAYAGFGKRSHPARKQNPFRLYVPDDTRIRFLKEVSK